MEADVQAIERRPFRAPLGAIARPSPSVVANASLAGFTACAVWVALGLAAARPPLAPYNTATRPGWLGGPLADLVPGLGRLAFVVLLAAMCLLYLAVLARSSAASTRWAMAAVVALQVVFTIAPPLVQTDLFGYLMYGRLGVLHHLMPYTHVANDVPWDPVRGYVGWKHFPSPYGPVFTGLTYGLAVLPVPVGIWALKAAAGIASLACVALTWSCARRLGRDPVHSSLFVGLNPLLLVWGVGAAHNDLMMLALMLGGVRLALAGREGLGAAAVIVGGAVKASSGFVLPFMVAGARRRGLAAAGAAIALAAVGALALAVFGAAGVRGFLATLFTQQQLVSSHSVPNDLFRVVGASGLPPALKPLFSVIFGVALVVLVRRTWRGADWITSAGWTTLVLLLTMTFLMPWYIVWLLPLAALGESRALRRATLATMVFLTVARAIVLLT